MFAIIKHRISVKITLTLLLSLLVIFALGSWFLIESRKQSLEQELFSKGQMAARVGAETFGHYLQELLDNGIFTKAELFDENYQLITAGELADSAIPKYHTHYDRYFDERIRHIEDAFLSDPMVVFAVLVDRNGYLPTHNSKYSMPLTGDAAKDRLGNRTKRLFNDPVGLTAATYNGLTDGPVLKQVYPRDTGVLMWDLSAPVTVHGQHWGAFRIGFSMEEADASVVRLRDTILATFACALAFAAILMMFLVTEFIRPLKQLTHSAQAIAAGRRKEKIELHSEDEIGLLVDSFNQMNESLETTTVSRDFYDMLLQSMSDLLIVTDASGQIVSVNRATCEVLGYTENHVVTHKVQELVALRNDSHDWFAAQVKVRQNYTADVDLVNCDKDRFPMAMSCSPLQDSERALTGFIFTFQDNSDRILSDQARAEAHKETSCLNERLSSANQVMEAQHQELAAAYQQLKSSQVQILQQEKMASIGQLAAGVAHEINNPMGFITSNLGTLSKYFCRLNTFLNQQQQLITEQIPVEDQQPLKAERKKLKIDYLLDDSADLIEESLDGAARVSSIVQNLKTFSRVDQDQVQDADINACLDSTINIAWNELKYKVSLEKDYGTLPLLHCYPQKLNQVFMNLLVNSAQAIEDKGIIKIRTWSKANSIYVEISDDGCGIAEENQARIFEPFFTTKEVGKGTGLGMSISYEIITEHGGQINVASTVGKGTTFTISLPLHSEENL